MVQRLAARPPGCTSLTLTNKRWPPDCAGVLFLGATRQRGWAQGFLHYGTEPVKPIHLLRLIGRGMPTVRLRQNPSEETLGSMAQANERRWAERWSRTIGALGTRLWRCLVGLRYGIVGVGRTGSGLALCLAQLGVHQLTLIDPDVVERHNLWGNARRY